MNSRELTQLLRQSNITNRYFLGCFMSTELSALVIPIGFSTLIVNTNVTADSMGHFISLIFYNNECFLIDSFGSPVWSYNSFIQNFLKKIGKVRILTVNRKQVQSPTGCLCPVYCIFVLYFASQNNDIHHVFDIFDSNYRNNDEKVYYWFVTLFLANSRYTISRNQLFSCQ